MNIEEFKAAVQDARITMSRADRMAKDVAPLMVGKLRLVSRDNMWSSHSTLVALKKELSQYNAKKREWKS